MNAIYQPRQIIDRRRLGAALDAFATEGKSEAEKRVHLLAGIRAGYKTGSKVIRERFEQGKASGKDTVAAHSYLMDQVIRIVFDAATAHFVRRGVPTTGERISVVAIGGYGRGELAPLSDVDLLFLLPYKPTPFSEQLVEFILYLLWDSGIKVGHAVRSVNENITHAKADMTIRTTLLDARWVWGDQELAAELVSRFKKEVKRGTANQFVKAKLAERDERHAKLGDSRYRLEPNVKEDKGALRDLHTLYWIAKYLYGVSDVRKLADQGILDDEASARFIKAQEFLSRVRCHIHYITGRTDNRLIFDLQREIAPRLGYVDRAGATAVERFMKHYFLVARDVGDLTRIFCTLLEESGRQKKSFFRLPAALRRRMVEGFTVERGRIGVTDGGVFIKDPVKLLGIFLTALEHGLDFQPAALRTISHHARRIAGLRRDPEANRIFMDILTSTKGPEATLRLMSECGVFGRFIPDFGRVVAQMQYDMYHVYTTDEHTIRAIGILHRIEQGKLKEELPVATDVVKNVQSRRALYASVLLHDIAKGRGGDHSDLGADIALELCPRLGLTAEETETVSWLVRKHLLMSNTAFKRDLDDPQTMTKFCEIVQSPERLKLLLVLTCADIRAVGPAVWNNWKATLLRELYQRADHFIRGGQAVAGIDARVNAAKAALAERLVDWPVKMREFILGLASPAFWLANDTDTHERLVQFMRAAEEVDDDIAVDFMVDSDRDVTHMVIYTPDHPGLFANIAGALALAGASVVDANILTLSNSKALDSFSLQDSEGHAITDHRFARIKARIVSALDGRLKLTQELSKAESRAPSRASALEVPPRVIIDNTASNMCSVIEVNGHDRSGFLSDVTKAITYLGLQIFSAHISTYGERVVDVFYVKDVFGMKIENDSKIRQIREALGKAIGVAADAVSVTRAERRVKPRANAAAE
ncbi:MAG: [protein-PII] uridylyltransferase [Rhodospirillaceae bacterium]|nr:[protein-PII] uridylyltransferase [Rhodospirillaceae bacterium]